MCACINVCLSVCLSVGLSVCLSVYLSPKPDPSEASQPQASAAWLFSQASQGFEI